MTCGSLSLLLWDNFLVIAKHEETRRGSYRALVLAPDYCTAAGSRSVTPRERELSTISLARIPQKSELIRIQILNLILCCCFCTQLRHYLLLACDQVSACRLSL